MVLVVVLAPRMPSSLDLILSYGDCCHFERYLREVLRKGDLGEVRILDSEVRVFRSSRAACFIVWLVGGKAEAKVWATADLVLARL